MGFRFDNCRLGSFACEVSLGYAALKLSLGLFRLGTLPRQLWLGNFRLATFDCDLSLGVFRLGSLALDFIAWELSPGNLRSGSLA